LAFVLALVSSVLLVFLVAVVRSEGPRSQLQAEAMEFALSAPGMILGALTNAVVLGAVGLGTALWLGRPVSARLRIGASRASPVGYAALTAGLLGLSFACGAARDLLRIPGGSVMDAMAHAFQEPSPGRFAAALLAIGVAPGIAEEAFFRGMMQTQLAAAWGRWPAIATTAAAFGLIHLDPVQGSLAVLAGLFLGWAVERFRGIRPTIVAHAINNAVFVAVAASSTSEEATRSAQWIVFAAGSAACAASIAVLRSECAVRASTPAS
jgi:membrane protease YdiL (CAAX protease family)